MEALALETSPKMKEGEKYPGREAEQQIRLRNVSSRGDKGHRINEHLTDLGVTNKEIRLPSDSNHLNGGKSSDVKHASGYVTNLSNS